MGAQESTLGGVEGYQVVRVHSNSPSHVAGFVAFFDFITAVDTLRLDKDEPGFFFDYIRRNKDKAVTCQVYNLRVRTTREVVVVPTDCWGGVGLLGCNVCWESADRALESTWHIVDVVRDSPAYRADLMSQRDYILAMQPALDGGSITTFRDGSDFHTRVEEWRARMAVANRSTPRTLLLMIFDSVDNSVKEVLLDMSTSNSIGVDVANGFLHVLPPLPNSDRLPAMRRFVATGPPMSRETSPVQPQHAPVPLTVIPVPQPDAVVAPPAVPQQPAPAAQVTTESVAAQQGPASSEGKSPVSPASPDAVPTPTVALLGPTTTLAPAPATAGTALPPPPASGHAAVPVPAFAFPVPPAFSTGAGVFPAPVFPAPQGVFPAPRPAPTFPTPPTGVTTSGQS